MLETEALAAGKELRTVGKASVLLARTEYHSSVYNQ